MFFIANGAKNPAECLGEEQGSNESKRGLIISRVCPNCLRCCVLGADLIPLVKVAMPLGASMERQSRWSRHPVEPCPPQDTCKFMTSTKNTPGLTDCKASVVGFYIIWKQLRGHVALMVTIRLAATIK